MSTTPRRPRARPGAAAFLVLLLALVLAVAHAAPAALAQTSSPTTTATAPALVSISPQVRASDTLRIELRAPGASANDTVRVSIFTRASRARLREIVEGRAAPDRIDYNPFVRRVSEVLDATRQTLVLSVPNDQLPQTPGVYPIQVTVGPSRPLTTWLVRVGSPAAGDAPYSLSLVVPVRAPLADRPDGTVALDPADTSRLVQVAAAIDALPAGSVTVVPTPETLDALDASGPEARATLEQLQAATRGDLVLGSTFVPIDIDAWRRAGRDDHVTAQLRTGRDTTARALGRSTTDVSTRAAVLAPYDTPSSLELLRREGVAEIVVTDTSLEPLRADAFPSPFAQSFRVRDASGQDLMAAAGDTWLASAVVDLDRAPEPGARAQQIIADLAAGFFDRPALARGSVVVLPTDWSPTTRVIEQLLVPLAGSSVVQLRDLDAYFTTVTRASPEREGQAESIVSGPLRRALVPTGGEDMGAHAAAVDATRATIESATALFGVAPSTRTTSYEELLLAASDVRLTADERRAYLDAITGSVARVLLTPDGRPGITVPESERLTLTTRRKTIRVVVDNQLSQPVTVRIDLRSEKLSFPNGDSITTILQPGPNNVSFDVRVKASGDSLVEYTVNAPSGSVGELAKGKLRVRSYALSGLGVVLSIVAGLVLATWWWRHARRTRRERRLAARAAA